MRRQKRMQMIPVRRTMMKKTRKKRLTMRWLTLNRVMTRGSDE